MMNTCGEIINFTTNLLSITGSSQKVSKSLYKLFEGWFFLGADWYFLVFQRFEANRSAEICMSAYVTLFNKCHSNKPEMHYPSPHGIFDYQMDTNFSGPVEFLHKKETYVQMTNWGRPIVGTEYDDVGKRTP